LKRKLILLALVLIVCAIALLVFCLWPRVRILDSRFHVVSIAANRGTNQTVWLENPVLGRFKDGLRKLGFPVKPTQKAPATLRDNTYIWLWVVYRGDIKTNELGRIETEIVDSGGRVTKLRQGIHERRADGKDYLAGWIQHLPPTNNLTYRLLLKLPNNGGPLAEIRLGEL
jgi:hypothetical protein